MNIFLIGFMGSGKSSVGKRLASRMGMKFLDSDREIEKQQQKKIPEIFKKNGELAFRQMEKEWLQNLEVSNAIVSLGGGTPCFEGNMELIKQKGTSIYLILSPEAIVSRLIKSKNVRPLVEEYKNDREALLKVVEEMLNKREVFYKRADLHLDALSVDADKLDQLGNIIRSKED
ncbi:MAG: shikimate kinase [Flavobacteriales bacterium]|nr:shikimate kinase [Flavobacteriales bacterium]